jgi:O-acetyl-ADP-ribose deacetylase (regulator of RNase III)
MLQVITGNLLDATEQYLAHQCNCTSRGGAGGIAAVLFEAYPYADTYRNRTQHDEPGTIEVRGNGKDRRAIISLNAQVLGGGPSTFPSDKDSAEDRERYFEKCLSKVAALPGLASIAFPYRVGCGIAGGDWSRYLGMLEAFADAVPQVQVAIYQRSGDL